MATDVRNKIAAYGIWCVDNKSWFDYTETDRSFPYFTPSANHHIRDDCGTTVAWCYWKAGAPDPMGLKYSTLGYTGDLINTGEKITQADIFPGDVVMYGPGTGTHTALIITPGSDPLTMSHGWSGEPALVRVSAGNPVPSFAPYYLRFNTYDSEPTTVEINFPVPIVFGADNNNVRTIQGLLTARGLPTQITGRFDAATREQVIKFQAVRNLSEHAVVGPETLAALMTA